MAERTGTVLSNSESISTRLDANFEYSRLMGTTIRRLIWNVDYMTSPEQKGFFVNGQTIRTEVREEFLGVPWAYLGRRFDSRGLAYTVTREFDGIGKVELSVPTDITSKNISDAKLTVAGVSNSTPNWFLYAEQIKQCLRDLHAAALAKDLVAFSVDLQSAVFKEGIVDIRSMANIARARVADVVGKVGEENIFWQHVDVNGLCSDAVKFDSKFVDIWGNGWERPLDSYLTKDLEIVHVLGGENELGNALVGSEAGFTWVDKLHKIATAISKGIEVS